MSTVNVAQPHRIVRATIPLDSPVAVRAGASPFTLVNQRGDRLATQCEVVALAGDDVNARIVEVLAIDPKACGGAYSIDWTPQRDGRPRLTEWARTQMAAPPQFRAGGEVLATQWSGGRGYTRNGDVAITRRFHGPHVTGWVTAYSGEEFIEVAFKLHNATPGSPPWFFKSLRILGDDTDAVEPLVPEPLSIGRELIPAREDGKWHYLRQRQVRESRVLIFRGSADVSALAYARGAGFGVSDQWTKHGAWGPGELRMPKLPAPMLANMRGWLSTEWARIRDSFNTGAAIDLGLGLMHGRIGIGHTTGGNHGGMTGGSGRWVYDQIGAYTALTGDPSGIRALHGKTAQIAYRMPALLTAEGQVCELEDWVDSTGGPLGNWQMSAADGRFESQGGVPGVRDGAFGFYAVRGEIPFGVTYDTNEYAAQAAISPVDFQHYVRAFSATASLAYLTNDPLSKHSLRSLSELFRMSLFTGSRAATEAAWVMSHPEHATAWGRAHGHGHDCAAHSYATSGKAWRKRRRPELQRFVEVIAAAITPSGCVQSTRGHKGQTGAPFNGDHGVQKATEAAFLAHAAHGCATLLGMLPTRFDIVASVGVNGFAIYHGGASQGAPSDWVAVNGPNRDDPPYAAPPPVTHWNDRTEVPIVYGLALHAFIERKVQPPSELLTAIRRYCGNAPDPRAWLLSQTLHNLAIDDTLALLSALE
jgi:hypothetical protein